MAVNCTCNYRCVCMCVRMCACRERTEILRLARRPGPRGCLRPSRWLPWVPIPSIVDSLQAGPCMGAVSWRGGRAERFVGID
eukprot:2190645-Pleurochrysis_carterae.AAC.2